MMSHFGDASFTSAYAAAIMQAFPAVLEICLPADPTEVSRPSPVACCNKWENKSNTILVNQVWGWVLGDLSKFELLIHVQI